MQPKPTQVSGRNTSPPRSPSRIGRPRERSKSPRRTKSPLRLGEETLKKSPRSADSSGSVSVASRIPTSQNLEQGEQGTSQRPLLRDVELDIERQSLGLGPASKETRRSGLIQKPIDPKVGKEEQVRFSPSELKLESQGEKAKELETATQFSFGLSESPHLKLEKSGTRIVTKAKALPELGSSGGGKKPPITQSGQGESSGSPDKFSGSLVTDASTSQSTASGTEALVPASSLPVKLPTSGASQAEQWARTSQEAAQRSESAAKRAESAASSAKGFSVSASNSSGKAESSATRVQELDKSFREDLNKEILDIKSLKF